MELKDDSFQKMFIQNMYQAWTDEMYCDAIINCGTHSIKAHRLVLASISDYFKHLFKYEITDDDNKRFYLLDDSIVNENCLRNIIQFAYTGNITLDINSVQDLLIAANYLQMHIITQKCENFITNNIMKYENEEIIHLLHFANMYDMKSLMDPICSYISENFYAITQERAFFRLKHVDIKSLLMNMNLSVLVHGVPVIHPEVEILKLVGFYLSKNTDVCEQGVISDLVEEIHFNEIKSLDHLKSIIDSFPILDCPKFQEILCLRQIRNLNTEVYIEKPLGPINKEKRRKFSNFNKRLRYGRQYGRQTGHENSKSLGTVYMDSDTADRPVRFTIWVTKTRFSFDIIGGIAIEYLNGRNVMFGKERTDSSLNSVHTFTLDDNEFITKVILGTSHHLDKIFFFSNFGKTYGPYGGNNGYDQVERPPGNNGYFYSLFAKDTINRVGLCCLRLLWVYFSSDHIPGDDDMYDVPRDDYMYDVPRDDDMYDVPRDDDMYEEVGDNDSDENIIFEYSENDEDVDEFEYC